MKVKANNLFYGMLPSKKDKKKLMAEDGMNMGNPVDPRIKNMVKTLPDDYFNIFGGETKHAQTPGLAPIDKGTPNVQLPNQQPQQQINPNLYNPGIKPQTNIPRRNPNVGNAIMLGLEAVDAAIPGERIHNQQVIQPQMGYAPHPLGTGSQALMDDGGDIGPGKPIKVGSKNDPRLKKYQDSLKLYNWSHSNSDHSGPDFKTTPDVAMHRGAGINYARLKGYDDTPTSAYPIQPLYDQRSYDSAYFPVYKKPVQPYEYEKPASEPKRSKIQSAKYDRGKPAVKGSPMKAADVGPKSTNFSFTGRDDQGQQDTRYFNDLDTWRAATEMMGYRDREVTGNGSEAHATGYQFDDGGWMMNPARDTPLVIPEGVGDNTPSAKSGNWIKGAVNPKHRGYCTPMTKSTCTPRRKAFAMTMKKHHGFHKKAEGGEVPIGPIKQLPTRSASNPQGPRYLFNGIQAPYSQPDSAQYSQAYSAALRGAPNYHNFANPTQGIRQSRVARNAILDALTTTSKHRHGGIIPDNMSNFSPHEYENGGSVNFLENIMFHPDQADMMGYAEYGRPVPQGPALYNFKLHKKEDGGPMRGGSDTPDMLENIFFHPNSADMQGFAYGGNMRGGSDTMNIFEQIVQHPNMEDMQDWDRAKSGKSLSPAKAREMLHDKTAHGYALTDKQRKYFGAVASGYAASGIGIGPGDPPSSASTKTAREKFYESSATLSYYKDKLNDKLKSKNPEAFGNYFKGLSDLRRSGNAAGASDYVQNASYNDYLSPDEVKGTLGDKDYQKYMGSLKAVNDYDIQQGQQPLYGQKEGENDVSKLNYGRRFASLQITPSVGVSATRGSDPSRIYKRQYKYNPQTGNADYQETGDLTLRPDYLSAPAAQEASTVKMRGGGVMYDDGGEVGTMWGGNVQQISDNPNDGGTMQFNGASHDNGGIGMHYNGNPVEVEGGETASKDIQGNLNIYGNMYLPGTRTKFKTVAKEIGEKEKRYDYLKTRGAELVNNSNPANKFDRLAFNAGKAMMSGGSIGQKNLADKKNQLASLQRAMLETAEENGIDAQHMSAGRVKKAKKGAFIPFAEAGDTVGEPNQPGRSTRNNNPGNIKYGKWAREHGASGKDADGFAIFPDKNVGSIAMQNLLKSSKYKNKTVNSAIKTWTGGKPYSHDLGDLEGKKVSDLKPEELDSVMAAMTSGEDTRYGASANIKKPGSPAGTRPSPRYGLPNIPLTPEAQRTPPGRPTPPELDHLNPPGPRNLPSNVEALRADEIAPELYAAATNKVEPVAMQKYNPQLYQPYQVSFQDRINRNQSTYNALQRTIGSTNPTALGEIAAQKYAADNAVGADEFRTNQAISDDITNKNIALRNDAQLKNLGLADTQYVRQSTAKSKTKEMNQMILNSISGKYAQNELENKKLAAYENLYDYRFTPGEQGGLNATYFGPNASFNYGTNPGQRQGNPDVRTVSRFDAQGNPKGYTTYDDDRLKQQRDAMELEMRRRKLPLLSAPPLN